MSFDFDSRCRSNGGGLVSIRPLTGLVSIRPLTGLVSIRPLTAID